jgi:hypothetical protein
LAVPDTTFGSVNGGDGFDTLRIDGLEVGVNLTTLIASNRVTSIEQVDLGEAKVNGLSLTADDVLQLTDFGELYVLGGAGDTVTSTGWTFAFDATFDGHDVKAYSATASGGQDVLLYVDADISTITVT